MRGSPFFDGVRQVELSLRGEQHKLPAFYYDSSSMMALFPARLAALRAMMPDPQYVPARLAPGVGVMAIACFEHRDIDIGPYNNMAIAIPLNVPSTEANLSGRALGRSLRSRQFHSFIYSMPESSETAVVGGIEFFNFPKFLAEVKFHDAHDERMWTLAQGHEHILMLKGRRIPAKRTATVRHFNHLWMDGQAQTAEFKMHQRKVGFAIGPGPVTLELGNRHPIAVELDRMLVSRRALAYEYVPSFEGILFQAEHLTPALMLSKLDALEKARDLAGRT